MDDALVRDNYSIHHVPAAFLELLIYLSNVFKVAKKISIDLVGLCVFLLSPSALINMKNNGTDHTLGLDLIQKREINCPSHSGKPIKFVGMQFAATPAKKLLVFVHFLHQLGILGKYFI